MRVAFEIRELVKLYPLMISRGLMASSRSICKVNALTRTPGDMIVAEVSSNCQYSCMSYYAVGPLPSE